MRHPNIHKLAPEEYIAWLHACIDYFQDKYYTDYDAEFAGVEATSEALKARLPREAWTAYQTHALGRSDLDRIEEYLQKTQEEEKPVYTFETVPSRGWWFYRVWKEGKCVHNSGVYLSSSNAEENAKIWIADQKHREASQK